MKTLKLSLSLFSASLLLAVLFTGCEPKEDEGIDLPSPPSASFTATPDPSNANAIIVTSNSSGFLHFYDFGNGQTSNNTVDTVLYPFEGMYEITYSVSNAGGMGTASTFVEIENSIAIPCEDNLALLTGCDNQKTWVFSQEAGAVRVGPVPYSGEWFTSQAGSLQNEQYDDDYQFTIDGEFNYMNQGMSVSPWQGFEPIALDVPALTYLYSPGSGTTGEDQVIVPDCWWMGVWDSGPAYDIVELTEDRLVLHSNIVDQDCQEADGFFTLIFVAE